MVDLPDNIAAKKRARAGRAEKISHLRKICSRDGLIPVDDFWIIRMAIRTLVRRVLVDHDGLFVHEARLDVALGARNVGVAAGERQSCFRVMIEGGRHPALRIMAICAMRLAVFRLELSVMRIVVTRFTGLGRTLKARLVSSRRLVALATGNRPVRTKQGELGLRMVEAIDIAPRLDVVTRFATKRLPVGAAAGHTIVELTFVGILVAGGAGAILKVKRKYLVGTAGETGFVAIRARDSDVSTGEREAGIFVLGDGVGGAVEVRNGVARLALIVVRRGGELIVVRVLVAIGAELKLDVVDGVLARRDVALGAVHLYVLALERIA